MQTKEVQKKFSENLYQNYDILNKELNDIYTSVCNSIENNYNGLLFSNIKKNWLKKLNTEEVFVMNIHDKIILAILNVSIYNAIVNENYEILHNGIYTYSRLKSLNHLHLTGFDFVSIIESLIFNDVLNYNTVNWKKNFEKQFKENFGDQMSGKFDIELLEVFKKTITDNNSIEDNFNRLLKLHSKCQWLTKGVYRECNLINYMPVFLIGVYKLVNQNMKIDTPNKWFIDFLGCLDKDIIKENKLVYRFSGKVEFLNKILDTGYGNFYNEYKSKCHFA